MTQIKHFSMLLLFCFSMLSFSGCKKEAEASCSDGIKNQGEEEIDCGGPCPSCHYLYFFQNGTKWQSDDDRAKAKIFGTTFQINGAQQSTTTSLQLTYHGLWEPNHSAPLSDARYQVVNKLYILKNASTDSHIHFTQFDKDKQEVSGSFHITLYESQTNEKLVITGGKFEKLRY